MTTFTANHFAASTPTLTDLRAGAYDALRAAGRRMPAPLRLPDFEGAGLRLAALVIALAPSAALSWMFVSC